MVLNRPHTGCRYRNRRRRLTVANLQLARSGIRFVPIPITADAELHLFGEILSRKLDELEKLVEEADTSPTV
ncbi:DUF1382 family protein [Escherichia coli]|uniref:DUF1382 family protein n=5 Tax=Enterobacteriaceae TaxID=543 RepID=A0AAN3HWF4_ECOLX|nr:DUF1382 family protein [Escherichia coli]AWJ37736.1 DUF1382 domain-containing protein [Escherichia coli O26 str. RM8426]AWJ53896.1 DUF1382 domain-containing protein [Escherichia coli O26 str. RM10386]EEC7192000.1 DUF1382 family protein [Escherichia coli O26]EER1344816.1 DUF1382 family protein [Escherichia coli O26:H11]EEW1216203.1 DUF1382 family protein [Escherichia coli O157:H7]EFA4268324.1 DUF1382 family protein [Escherichia coli O145:H25]EFT1063724.1 DUF1382 family protein [Shigella so